MQLTIRKVQSRVWEWVFESAGEFIAGGYCRTKREAQSDAASWQSDH